MYHEDFFSLGVNTTTI